MLPDLVPEASHSPRRESTWKSRGNLGIGLGFPGSVPDPGGSGPRGQLTPANRSDSTNYFGGVGVEPGATIVPQRGQCAQTTSIGDWQELQVRGPVEVTVAECTGVEDLLSSSGSAAIPFLNSFMDFPSDFARSGSFLPPMSTKTITRIRSSSW
jgi:hypothetical protein